MEQCLKIVPRLGGLWCYSIVLEETYGTHRAQEGRNFLNTFPNGANEVFIGIYIENKCQWRGRFISI